MQNLLIEQKGPQGLIKTWKLRSEQGVVTFGSSKHADVRSPADGIKGIQGVFEFKRNKWYYVNLDLHTHHPELKNKTELCIDGDIDIRFGTSSLHIKPLESKSKLFTTLEGGDIVHSGTEKKPYQLYTVYSGTTLLETKLIPVYETFVSSFDLSETKFKPEKTENWKVTDIGNLKISQRTVYLSSIDELSKLDRKQLMDDDSKKPMIATLIGMAVLSILFVMAPSKNSLDEVLTPIPQPIVREVKIDPPKKKQAQSAPKEEPKPQQTQQVAAAPKNTGGGSSKSASMIKSLASGRITQLVGKVSAAAARSVNVVVTSGVAAGSAPTGRALAALGSISKSGKDWSSEGKGTGITISTNGKAGGQGTAGMGTLSGGKTGQGGVGLLEDEGEITGGLDRDIIAQYIKSQLGQILYCYERQLSANPDLYGKVAIKFTIGGDGGVETQRIGDSSLKNPTVEGCILQRVAKWKFPAPEGGTKVLVTYPFLFKSTN